MTTYITSGPDGPRPFQKPVFFSAPPVGRRILGGFSYLQRIGKAASTQVWIPETFEGHTVQWAAVRQFELLQESCNYAIEELEVTNFKKLFESIMKMRAGGYRVTIITLGDYTQDGETDDLLILDQRLQEEITRLIHFLYLNEQSDALSDLQESALHAGSWDLTQALPHVAMVSGAKQLFRPHASSLAERAFFQILERLPQNHIVHDVAVGLKLPESTKDKIWVYLAPDEQKFNAFQRVMGTIFSGFDAFSMDGLQGRGPHRRDEMPVMHSMRGYGDRLTPRFEDWHRQMATLTAA